MDSTFNAETSVSTDGNLVVFVALVRGHAVQCSITRDALEQYFWAPLGADDRLLLKAYMNGQKRIAAAAERKMLKAPHEPVRLGAADFSH